MQLFKLSAVRSLCVSEGLESAEEVLVGGSLLFTAWNWFVNEIVIFMHYVIGRILNGGGD